MTDAISSYEQRAWAALLEEERRHRKGIRARLDDGATLLVSKAGQAIRRVPGAERVSDGTEKLIAPVLNAATKSLFLPAIRTASLDRRTKALRKRHPHVGDANPFVILDLKDLDRGRPQQVTPVLGAAAAAGASLAITGVEVSTSVTGGVTAGAVIAALAGDIASSLALLGRCIAEVAVHYGYDPTEPAEEMYLMSVLNYTTASSLEGKTAALAGLSRLTQQMMRHATWNELRHDVVVKIIQRIFTKIGVRLTHRRLAQVVPIVGGLISAGLSYDMLSTTQADATRIYRARFLSEKHGWSFDDWAREESTRREHGSADENLEGDPSDASDEIIDIAAEVRDVLAGAGLQAEGSETNGRPIQD